MESNGRAADRAGEPCGPVGRSRRPRWTAIVARQYSRTAVSGKRRRRERLEPATIATARRSREPFGHAVEQPPPARRTMVRPNRRVLDVAAGHDLAGPGLERRADPEPRIGGLRPLACLPRERHHGLQYARESARDGRAAGACAACVILFVIPWPPPPPAAAERPGGRRRHPFGRSPARRGGKAAPPRDRRPGW